MRISELVVRLDAIRAEVGDDIEVICDAMTSPAVPLRLTEVNAWERPGETVVIIEGIPLLDTPGRRDT